MELLQFVISKFSPLPAELQDVIGLINSLIELGVWLVAPFMALFAGYKKTVLA